jgi:hypothetical protein
MNPEMKIGDLVHHTCALLKDNLGLIVGFDSDNDPIIEWIIFPGGVKNERLRTAEYIEDILLVQAS